MATISPILSKSALIDYCLRKLGAPVVQVNVVPEQVDDCLLQTVETWWLYHPDGLEKVYLKRQVTGSQITVVDATGFAVGDNIVKGTVSPNPDTGTTAFIHSIDGNVITIENQVGPVKMVVGDVLTIVGKPGITTTITNIVLGDMDNRWVPTSDLVYGVSRILPFGGGSGGATSSSRSMFDLQYQMRLNNMADLTSTSIAYYVQAMTHLGMLDQMLNGPNLFRFNRLTNKLFIEAAWGSEIHVGDWVIAECYVAVDPDANARVFNDPWIRKHLTANIKQQWGSNMKKFQGIQMLGGVTIDGQGLFDEGTQEMADLESDLLNNGAPLEWFMG